MVRFKKKNKNLAKQIAICRIDQLFKLAASEYNLYPERSNRYVTLARKIGLRYVIRFPFELKIKYCKNCGCYLVNGSNSRIRLRGRYMVITCLCCNHIQRFPYH